MGSANYCEENNMSKMAYLFIGMVLNLWSQMNEKDPDWESLTCWKLAEHLFSWCGRIEEIKEGGKDKTKNTTKNCN